MTGKPKLLLDGNILTDGLFSRFGLSKAVLALCAAKTCRLCLSEYVKTEVERNILKKAAVSPEAAVEQLIKDYTEFIRLSRPTVVPSAEENRVIANRALICHFADVPVVLAATDGKVDWLITRNRDHFTDEVAAKIGIKIAPPAEFFLKLVKAFDE